VEPQPERERAERGAEQDLGSARAKDQEAGGAQSDQSRPDRRQLDPVLEPDPRRERRQDPE
jgi:hypothetical protein